MKTLHPLRRWLTLWPITVFAFFVTAASSARATTTTWLGSTSGSWTDATNWSGGVPGASIALFNGAGNGNTTLIISAAATNYAGIEFDSGAAAYTLGTSPNSGIVTMSSGASILITSAETTSSQIINSSLILAPSPSGSMTLENDSTGVTLTQAGSVRISSSSGATTHILNVAGVGNTIVSGQIINNSGGSGTLSIVKSGTGTLTLSSVSSDTYTGATQVNGGVLAVNTVLGSGANVSAVTIGGSTASGTPILTGTGTVGGGVTISSAGSGAAGTINPGAVGGTPGTLTIGSAAFQSGSTLAIDVNSTSADKLIVTGAASFAGTNNITFNGSTGATTTSGVGDYQIMTVGSGANLTASTFTGTAPADYHLVATSGGASLDLQHEATIGTITATPSAAQIITGGSTAYSFTVSNTAPTNSTALSASASAGSNTTGSVAGPITAAAGATSSSQTGMSFNGTTVGAGQHGTFSVTDANADNSPQTGTVTVDVLDHASGSTSGSSLNLGNIHAGYATAVTSSNSITASNASGFRVNLSGSGASGNISLTSVSGVAAGGTSGNITATLATGQGVGAISTPVTYTFADNSALSGASSNVGTQAVTVSGQVYSGTSTWNATGGGTWGTLSTAFGTNWGASQGSPGLDSNFTSTDSATFGGTVASGTAHVTLDGASPSLNAITFNNASANYSIEQGTGSGSITLNGGVGNASVTDTAGTNAVISAPVALATNANVSVASGQQLTFSGPISGSGKGLTNSGAGTTILSGSNSYTGNTSVTGGTTILENTSGSATGSGALSVGAGATLAGKGSSSGSSFSVSGASGNKATVLVGQNASAQNTDTNTSAKLALSGSSLSTIANANLVFNLNAAAVGGSGYDGGTNVGSAGTELSVGNTAINFGSGVQLTLNLQNEPAFVGAYTPFVLIAGTGTTTISGTSSTGQYTGLTFGGLAAVQPSQGTATIITGGNLALAFGNALDTSYYGTNSYLVLYQDAAHGIDDIDVIVVPEPETWAFMLSGLVFLGFYLRRKTR